MSLKDLPEVWNLREGQQLPAEAGFVIPPWRAGLEIRRQREDLREVRDGVV